jgi:hypothetical protein
MAGSFMAFLSFVFQLDRQGATHVPAVHVVETIESASDRRFYAPGRDFLPARYFRGARSYHVNRSSGFTRESPSAGDCLRLAPVFSEFSARRNRRARIGT